MLAGESPLNRRYLSSQHTSQLLSSQAINEDDYIEDNPYQRISKNDEGNIGGTLSNNDASSPNFADEDHFSNGQHRDGSAVMQFAEALEAELSNGTPLRVPQVQVSQTSPEL